MRRFVTAAPTLGLCGRERPSRVVVVVLNDTGGSVILPKYFQGGIVIVADVVVSSAPVVCSRTSVF